MFFDDDIFSILQSTHMNTEKKRFIGAVYIPLTLLVIMWVVKLVELAFNLRFSWLGVHPLRLEGLPGILFSPLLHGDINHLTANSVPFLVLATALFYFYREISIKVLIGIWLLSGVWIWFGGQSGSVHIGASSLIYGLSSFLFVSGLIRKDTRLAALALIVAFLYGSIVWGVFPDFFPKKNISWEGHLGGLVAGIILAFYYKKAGPQRKRYSWEFEEEDDTSEDTEAYWNIKNRDSTS
ncbi:MAG: rhomboid family intramembrane serine protease [Bacteroidetes bacterium]|nr:MAG: rhomboid family intramembrane serine protease [Bacteroidota bacterium]RLD89855.1 MAG: rhomboid family intramembrane serine protease [Bacteroidota bacterium]